MTAKKALLTMDLEPDCGGRLNSFLSMHSIEKIVDLIARLAQPITVFVSGRVFEVRPDAIHKLAVLPAVEFGVHGYSHAHGLNDNALEIKQGSAAYEKFFGHLAKGYRSPQGRLLSGDLDRIANRGFAYDSSLIPGWRPGKYRNLFSANIPHRLENGMVEIPITSMHPWPMPLGFGYFRMVGHQVSLGMLRTAALPETVTICFHPHDIIRSEGRDRLSGFWRWFYGRNVSAGEGLLIEIVTLLSHMGYSFHLACEVSEKLYTSP